MFWRNKSLGSEEFEKVLKRVILLEADIDSLKKKIDSVNTNLSSLRGLVNRKLRGEPLDNSELDDPLGESSIKDDGFNWLRGKDGIGNSS